MAECNLIKVKWNNILMFCVLYTDSYCCANIFHEIGGLLIFLYIFISLMKVMKQLYAMRLKHIPASTKIKTLNSSFYTCGRGPIFLSLHEQTNVTISSTTTKTKVQDSSCI